MKVKQWQDIFHVIVNTNSIAQHVIQIKNLIISMWIKNYHKWKTDHSWNSSTCICENSINLKSIADTSVTECDEL